MAHFECRSCTFQVRALRVAAPFRQFDAEKAPISEGKGPRSTDSTLILAGLPRQQRDPPGEWVRAFV